MKSTYRIAGLLIATGWLVAADRADAQLRQFGQIRRQVPANPQPVGPRVAGPNAGIFNPRGGGIGVPLPAANAGQLGNPFPGAAGFNPGFNQGFGNGFNPGFNQGFGNGFNNFGPFGPYGPYGFNGASPFGFNPFANQFANPFANPFATPFAGPFGGFSGNQFGNPYFNPYFGQPFGAYGFSPFGAAQLQNLLLTAQLAQLYGLPLGQNNNNTAPVVGVGNPGLAGRP